MHFSISDDISCVLLGGICMQQSLLGIVKLRRAENPFEEQDGPNDTCLKMGEPGVSSSSFSIS